MTDDEEPSECNKTLDELRALVTTEIEHNSKKQNRIVAESGHDEGGKEFFDFMEGREDALYRVLELIESLRRPKA